MIGMGRQRPLLIMRAIEVFASVISRHHIHAVTAGGPHQMVGQSHQIDRHTGLVGSLVALVTLQTGRIVGIDEHLLEITQMIVAQLV